MKVSGKVAVVTGAGHGLGAAVARRFAAEGAMVVVSDIDGESVNSVASEIGGIALAADMSTESGVQAVVRLAEQTHGRVDIWHSNAGYAGPRQPGVLQANELWDQMWHLHVMSHVYASRAVVPGMIDRGEGYLLATASTVALPPNLRRSLMPSRSMDCSPCANGSQ
jgi:NAD(P)-dependent dehydrogenase (short-subunit alcohol dehydrogenase family)